MDQEWCTLLAVELQNENSGTHTGVWFTSSSLYHRRERERERKKLMSITTAEMCRHLMARIEVDLCFLLNGCSECTEYRSGFRFYWSSLLLLLLCPAMHLPIWLIWFHCTQPHTHTLLIYIESSKIKQNWVTNKRVQSSKHHLTSPCHYHHLVWLGEDLSLRWWCAHIRQLSCSSLLLFVCCFFSRAKRKFSFSLFPLLSLNSFCTEIQQNWNTHTHACTNPEFEDLDYREKNTPTLMIVIISVTSEVCNIK